MTRTRPAAVLVIGCVLSIGFAACGEDEETDFKEGYNAAVKPLSEVRAGISSELAAASGKSNDAFAKKVQGLADKAQEARDNLAELDPPEDAKESFDQLLRSLGDGADDLRALATAARESDPAAAREAQEELKASGEAVQRAETALQEAVDG